MKFFEAVSICLNKYADFSGRARRSEYWFFVLFDGLASALVSVISGEAFLISSLFSLFMLLPSLAVSWRRMHDIGKAGPWMFVGLIPLVGWVFVLVWCCRDSEPGHNAYGPNPKA